MNSQCVLASCRAGLWSSFKHLAGFLKLKHMPRRSRWTHLWLERTSSPCASSHSSTMPWIVIALSSTARRYTKWTSGEGAHFNSEYLGRKSTLQQWIWNCQKCNKVVANSQNLRPKANKNGPRVCSKLPKSKQHRNPQANAQNCGLCLAKIVYNTRTCSNDDHAAPSPRSSPAWRSSPAHDLRYLS